jgi:hypothetical protein
MGAVYLPLESQRRLIGLSRMALEEVVYGAKSQLSSGGRPLSVDERRGFVP